MKVVTIGRSIDNDVCINDSYVGRHHCQIVQHDNGMFTIVDMNSTNGTYVNGRRVFGEAQLQPYDSITIGHTNLPWRNYFPPKSKSYALPIVLGSVGGVLLTIVLTVLFFRHGSDKAFAFKGEYPDAVVVNMVDEDGTPYTIEAIDGQVCVWFEEGILYKTAQKSIKALGGRIVAQIPENGYYLVELPADKVQIFLKKIKKENFVDWAYPNVISYSCAVYNYVLDNYYRDTRVEDTARHGYIVEHALQEYGSNIAFRHFNIGNKNGYNTCASNKLGDGCVNSEFFALDTISRLNNSGPIFINMSYGPSLPKRKKPNGDPEKYYWKEATDQEKKAYQINYCKSLKNTIKNLKSLEGKDYVVVVAAGNEGVKSFGDSIISYLRNSKDFTEYEKGIMDKHFLLVTAGEEDRANEHYRKMMEYETKAKEAKKRNNETKVKEYKAWQDYELKMYNSFKRYSNEMENGRYDPWVTKTDISDFKYRDGKEWRGTSFAAPRAAGILSSVANEMNLTGAEILELAREVTKRDGELTKESLMQAANEKQSNTGNKEMTIEGVLRMYLLDNMGGGSVTYYLDKEGNAISAVGEDDSEHPYCQTIYEYRETDFDNTYLAFVVETEKAIDVNPYHIEDASFVWDGSLPNQSAFEISLPHELGISEREFASKYANKRVRVSGTLYAVVAGWRHATDVGLYLKEIKLLETFGSHESSDSQNTRTVQSTLSLKGSVWESRNHSSFYTKRTLEFISNESVRITEYQFWTDNKTFELKYFYKKEDNEWRIVVNAAGDQEPFYIKDGVLVEYSFVFGRNRPIQEYKRIK